jgi:hypothetical protein
VDDQPTPEEAREALHAVVDQLTDAAVVLLWRLLCAWVAWGPRQAQR